MPCVKFLNFRSQWQGVTEANLEKIFNLLKALWPVAVMIDEADAFLGNRDASRRLGHLAAACSRSIASFMGNTEYRGKIIWFLLTCRPDLLPIDLKRQGRAEEHLALFYPQTDAERDELLRGVREEDEGATSTCRPSPRCCPRPHADVRRGHRGGAGALQVPGAGRRAGAGHRRTTSTAVVDGLRRRPATRWRSSCRTWPRCRSAPAASCCRRSSGRWSGTASPGASAS